ncbi:MAG: tetratricopeptide repeat protein, partial [Planctomycetales bacterium]
MTAQLLKEGLEHHQAGRREQAEQCYRQVIAESPQEFDALQLLGVLVYQSGRGEEAIELLRRAAEIQPDHAELQNNLGGVYQGLGKLDEAAACFQSAARLDPNNAKPHVDLANIHARQGKLDEAVGGYRESLRINPQDAETRRALGNLRLRQGDPQGAIEELRESLRLRPDSSETLLNLGNAQGRRGEWEEAAASYRRALEVNPSSAEACNNLGAIHERLQQLDDATAMYLRAIELKPDYAEAHNNLGNAYSAAGRLGDAVGSLLNALRIRPEYAAAHNNLGNVYKRLKQYDQAEASYREALRIDPSLAAARVNAALVYKSLDRMEEAAAEYHAALRLQPDEPLWEFRAATLFPTVLHDVEELERRRQELLGRVDQFTQRDLRIDPATLSQSGCEPPFCLQFHGCDDRPIKEAYGRLFQRYVPAGNPPVRPSGYRVGIVVTKGHDNVFLTSLRGVLSHIDLDKFEITVVCHALDARRIREQLARPEIQILETQGGMGRIVDVVRGAEFDLLYFWEVGTDSTNYFLPFFRAAPVQCASWGIQDTSGIPEMDYYLSSELVELPGAEDHYSETLVLARTLLTYQYRSPWEKTSNPRQEFGFTRGQRLYVCAQHLGKFHPDFDLLLGEILRRDPAGVVGVTKDQSGTIAAKLRNRMQETMPGTASRVVFLPRQDRPRYLNLLAAADVLLDPPYFGGVNTTYDGFSLNKAIVTCPS